MEHPPLRCPDLYYRYVECLSRRAVEMFRRNEAGDILVIGFFNDVEPAAHPRRGIPYVPPPE
jgi:hypothetical protein